MIAGDTLAEVLQTELNARKPKNWDNICCSYNQRLEAIDIEVFARYEQYTDLDLRLAQLLPKEHVYILPYKQIIAMLDERFKEDLDNGLVGRL